MLTYPAVFLLALLLSGGSQAQTLSDCRLIDSDVSRLICYDKLPSGTLFPTKSIREIIASYRGLETHSTRPFNASGPWEMEWSFDKSGLIFIHDVNGKILDHYSVGGDSSNGNVSWQNSGIFNLEVITTGRWEIKIRNSF